MSYPPFSGPGSFDQPKYFMRFHATESFLYEYYMHKSVELKLDFYKPVFWGTGLKGYIFFPSYSGLTLLAYFLPVDEVHTLNDILLPFISTLSAFEPINSMVFSLMQ